MEDVTGAPLASISCVPTFEGETAILSVAGELDLSNIDVVRNCIDDALGRNPARLVFEVSQLEFIDSSGLGLLLGAASEAAEIELRKPTPAVRRLVELTGLEEILPMSE